nr:hypothetical protein [Salinispora vitiensis]
MASFDDDWTGVSVGDDWMGVSVLAVGCISVVLVVVVWQVAATWRARMLSARERQNQELVVKCVRLLEENAELQRRTLAEIAQVREVTSAMEKMMRAVG